MPVKWETRDTVLVLSADGDYRAEELVQAVVEAMRAPAFRPGMFILFDGRQSRANISPSDIDWRVSWIASLPRMGFSSHFAVVVNDEVHRFGLARMLSLRLENEGVDLAIFHDADVAMEWLTGSIPRERV
jgi:hypothetical protein